MEKVFSLIFVIREEIVSIVVLLCLLTYCIRTQRTSRDNSFIRICMFSLLHVMLDAAAFLMGNYRNLIFEPLNDFVQKLLYISAVMVLNEIFTYVHGIAYFKKKKKNVRIASYCIVAATFLVSLFFKVKYVEIGGVVITQGIPLAINFAVGIIYEISTIVLLIVRFREVGESFCKIMIPVEVAILGVIMAQVFRPEILATGGIAAVVATGMFLALENPVDAYRQQAFIDMYTGVRNKNCYKEDQKRLKNEKKKVGVILFDLNNLKIVNDNYGHLSGDDFISAGAQIIKNCMKDAWRIYRIGGDEFCAIYIDPDTSVVLKERQEMQDECVRVATFKDYPFGIADGYADGFIYKTSYEEIVSRADEDLYKNKRLMKEIDKYEFR
ncbi:GGDEF domain-containing protein [Lachnospiraceae bacterium C1.1]|nr:GGDEF domain-containing protein [Lachnospiraceae bacterium C1.1]